MTEASNLGWKKMWCVPNLTPEYIERMEAIIDLYQTVLPKNEVLLCFDEKSKQLITDTRLVQNTTPTCNRKRDYEYKRGGTQNIFVTVEPYGGHREVTVTDTRTRIDFANEMKRILTLLRYAKMKKIHMVLDNLNTHNEKSLIERFGKKETKHMMKRLVFHYTPKHASWLNMAEIEIGILDRQCIRGRIGTKMLLKKQIRVWKKERNALKKKICWKFTKEDARRVFRYGGGVLS